MIAPHPPKVIPPNQPGVKEPSLKGLVFSDCREREELGEIEQGAHPGGQTQPDQGSQVPAGLEEQPSRRAGRELGEQHPRVGVHQPGEDQEQDVN